MWFLPALAQIMSGTSRYRALLVAVAGIDNEIKMTVEKLGRVERKDLL